MELKIHRFSIIRWLLPVITLTLFTVALIILHEALQKYHYHQIVSELRAVPLTDIVFAVCLTILSYLLLTVYDQLALSYVRHPVSIGKVALASFISYAFSNSVGLSFLTSGSIRYRLYSAWGLTAEEITQIVTFTTLTLWLGLITTGGIIFNVEPMAIPVLENISIQSVRPLGILFIFLAGSYLLAISLRKQPICFWNWEFSIPSIRMASSQLLAGSLDWVLACGVLYVLLPEQSQLPFSQFVGIYLLAQVVALISHVPGGLGVFESMILLLATDIPADALLGSMLIYRVIYYLLPLALATLLLGIKELLQNRSIILQTARTSSRWLGAMAPHLLAVSTLFSGAVLLFSGATPAAAHRLQWLGQFLPLPVIEMSHFSGSLVGVCLLLLARGLQRRLDASYILTAILLGIGSILSLLKGADYEEASLLVLIMLALLPCRKHFYRRSSLFSESFSLGWITMILLIFIGTAYLGFFAYKHVDYTSQLWWQFTLKGEAPRYLRAMVGSMTLLVILAIAKLMQPARIQPQTVDKEETQTIKSIIAQSSETLPNLALLGDKVFLFDDQKKGFVMYGVQGNSWVALGDPVGPPDVAEELAWQYREMVERHGGQTIFYQVCMSMIHVYLDMGLTLFKLGEEASVYLADFSLKGKKRSNLRNIHNRFEKDGCSFEILPPAKLPEVLPELRKISNAWLNEKNTSEKGFSLGLFDEQYILNFPVAVVRLKDEIIAFSNIWITSDNNEMSIDLMRYGGSAPKNVMDYLFISLLLWGKEQGYQYFNLGMAPLSGLDNRPFAPLWNRIGSVVFQHGEQLYNFDGLRNYKEKFAPRWTPRYLVCSGGFSLPRNLINITALISGGLKGIFTK
jgi:phosphatidylglycerol lysyltransferase